MVYTYTPYLLSVIVKGSCGHLRKVVTHSIITTGNKFGNVYKGELIVFTIETVHNILCAFDSARFGWLKSMMFYSLQAGLYSRDCCWE